MESLIGKIAFLEPIGDSLYGSGEYVIVQHSETTIHGYPLINGYHGSKLKSMPTVGSKPWKVVAVRDNPREILAHADLLEEFSREPERCRQTGEKKAWVESVYNDAATVARRLKILAEQGIAQEIALVAETCETCECDDDGTLHLSVPAGVRRIVIDL